jgi:hypothetical protein
MELMVLLVVLGSAVWVRFDASGRDWSSDRFANSPAKWVIGCLLLWLVVFPAYLIKRGRALRKGVSGAAPRTQFSPPVAFASPVASVAPPGPASYRPCPDCAEDVRIEARKCRFCGLELTG